MSSVIIKYWAKQDTTDVSSVEVDEKDVATKCREIIDNGGMVKEMEINN